MIPVSYSQSQLKRNIGSGQLRFSNLFIGDNHGYRKKTGFILSIFITLWVCHQILI